MLSIVEPNEGNKYRYYAVWSMAISFVDNCKKTWRPLWGLARELYADSSLTKPTALHGESTALQPALKTFSEHNSTFVAELPVLTGVNNSLESRYLPPDNLYQFVDSISNEYLDGEDINKQIFDLSQESYKLILKAHNLQRRKASEVLLFVCTDSDRAFNKDKPSSIPIAYTLKGKSIRISTARKMINMVRDKLKDNGTSILCEAVDGQWSGIVFRDESLKPLTLFELQRDSWLKFAKMSKENILLFLHNLSYVSYADKDLCSRININYFASHRYGNIEVHIDPFRRPADGVVVRRIFVHSYCGEYNQGSVLNMLKTPLKAERQDLWHKSIGVSNNLLQVLGLQEPSTVTGDEAPLTEDSDEIPYGEDDELLNLRADIVDESGHTTQISSGQDGTLVHTGSNEIKCVLLGSHKCVLEDILIALLCSDNCIKWSAYNCREFYEFALSSTNAIYTSMTTHDIDIVINVLRKWECPSVSLGMKLNVSKLQKANQLGFILGHTDFIGAKKTKPKMKSLVDLTLDELKSSVPVEVLRVALSQFDFRMKLPLWMDKCPLPICYEIPIEPGTFDVFSYPEFNVRRQQLEPRIIDPSHVLTNLRLHATQKGILRCDPNAFLRVADVDNNVLSRGLIVGQPLLDQQSVPFARKVFSSDVEAIMWQNGDVKEANLVKIIRNWYDACNERSISVSDRIMHLIDMHNHLMRFYNPQHFPMNTSYVANLPATTFQSIMHNISTRIHLYHISKFKTYNHRSVSTLAVESLFADLTSLAANTNGVPLAANIPKHISKMTLLNAAKNDPSK